MSPRRASGRRRWLPPALLALVALLPLLQSPLPQRLHIASEMVPIFYYAILGLGLNLVVGSTGLLNLGAAAFMAAGAYAFAILTCEIYPFQIGFWPGLAAAVAVAGGTGLVLGLPTMRLRGDYLAIVTLGFGEIVQDLLRNLYEVTQGTKGINPLPSPVLGSYVFPPTSKEWVPWYYLYLALVVAVVLGLRWLERSRFGRALVAIREDELAANCMGVDVPTAKLAAFAGGAALCGLAGALFASALGTSSEPGNFDFNLSILALCIVILGGMGNLHGVLLGALIMAGFNAILLVKLDGAIKGWLGGGHSTNPLLAPTNWKYLIFGLTLVLMMRFRPEGLLPSRRVREELRDASATPPEPTR